MKGPDQIRFVVDRMLGRLARMLRLLGYDTRYDRTATPADLGFLAQQEGRVLLTRGAAEKRFTAPSMPFVVPSDSPPVQLREVVRHFALDTQTGLWTRCTLCNGALRSVEKAAVATEVPPRAFEAYQDFFRCSGCGKIYWRGSHVERTNQNLQRILLGQD